MSRKQDEGDSKNEGEKERVADWFQVVGLQSSDTDYYP